jgi:hypothetical protein
MKRFYFHLAIGSRLLKDEDGVELPSKESARAQAVRSTRELVADAIKHGINLHVDAIVVADDQGKEIARVSTKEVLPKRLNSD